MNGESPSPIRYSAAMEFKSSNFMEMIYEIRLLLFIKLVYHCD